MLQPIKRLVKNFNSLEQEPGALIAEFRKLNLISKSNQAHRNIALSDKQLKLIPTLKVNKSYSTMEFRK